MGKKDEAIAFYSIAATQCVFVASAIYAAFDFCKQNAQIFQENGTAINGLSKNGNIALGVAIAIPIVSYGVAIISQAIHEGKVEEQIIKDRGL